MPALRALGAVTLATLLLAVPSARAAVIEKFDRPDSFVDGFRVTGDREEASRLRIEPQVQEFFGHHEGWWFIDERNRLTTPDCHERPDAAPEGGGAVYCETGESTWVWEIDLRDGDDVLSVLNGGTLGIFTEPTIFGGEGDDRLVSESSLSYGGNHFFDGGPGDDTLIGNDDWDKLRGGPGNDRIETGEGYDPSIGAEQLGEGGDGDDVILGGPQLDALSGGAGDDTLDGGDGDDDLAGGIGADDFTGGDGIDHVRYERPRTRPGVDVTLDDVADDGSPEDRRLDNVRRDVEVVHGTDSPDRFVGNELPNAFQGFDGADVMLGEDGPDTLIAGGGADVDIRGGQGNDILWGQLGDDRLLGGEDDDELEGQEDDDDLVGGPGDDVHRGGDGTDLASYADRLTGVIAALDGGAGHGAPGEDDQIDADVEGLAGGEGQDRLAGNDADNVLLGGGRKDVVEAGDGDDRIDPGEGALDEVYAGPGADIADYSSRRTPVDVTLDGEANDGAPREQDNIVDAEWIWGGFGDDRLTGDGQLNRLEGGDGADTLDGAGGPDVLVGGEGGHDTVSYAGRRERVTVDLDSVEADNGAAEEHDVIGQDVEDAVAGAGGSTLMGDRGPNVLTGGEGVDVIDGAGGRDTLAGAAHNDTLTGGGGIVPDSLDGGPGGDTASYAERIANVRVDLDGTDDDGQPNENDHLAEVEHVTGGDGSDTLVGDGLANRLTGGPGADDLDGAGGSFDVVSGDAGGDTLSGGTGRDFLRGGADNDSLNDGGADAADVLEGGTGTDIASYAQRGASVELDLDGAADDGEAGEGDLIATDVEWLVGGSGADILRGADGAEELFGGHGDDRLAGGPGPDALRGGPGADTADYRSALTNVVADIDGVADDGRDVNGDGTAEEGDNVHLDVENLQGGTANDRLRGSAEENVLSGNAGDDSLDGGPGLDPDVLLGGSGTDTADYSRRSSRLTLTLDGVANDGAELNPLVEGAEERDAVGPGVERLRGGAGDDWLAGTSGAQELFGGGGADVLDGGPGGDLLDGGTDGTAGDTVTYMRRTTGVVADLDASAAGDDGTDADGNGVAEEGDRITATVEHLVGGAGRDALTGDARGNDLEGLGGNDRLDGREGDDALEPGRHLDRNRDGDADVASGGGADVLVGGDGRDSVSYRNRSNPVVVDLDGTADDGEDTNANGIANEADNAGATVEDVVGTLRPDRITGNAAANRLDGVDGADRLRGMAGADELLVDDGLARMDGGSGPDRLAGRGIADYAGRSIGVAVTLDGNANDGTDANGDGVGEEGDDVEGVARIEGGAGDDRLTGSATFEQLAGNGGDDSLFGLGEDDWLFGGPGADVLDGGTGRDAAIYVDRTEPLAIDIDGVADDGTDANGDGVAEEGDNVRLSVEDVAGGAGADRIRGSSAPNILVGGAGGDLLTGAGGADTLRGLAGADELRAAGDGAADVLECGTEIDRAFADVPPDAVGADCEQLGR